MNTKNENSLLTEEMYNELLKKGESIRKSLEEESMKYDGTEMVDKKIELSDEEIDAITKTLKESTSEDVNHLREINEAPYPNNVLNKPELIEAEVLVETNPITGEQIILGPADMKKENDVTVDNILDETDQDLLDSVTIREETYQKLNEFGLTEEEAKQFGSVILRRLQGEKFKIYKELPEKIKGMVRSMCGSNNINHLQACSEIVVDQFVSELKIEQEFVDFQDSLKKELGNLDMMNMYEEYLKETMGEKLLKKADEIEETHPEKAKVLREISEAFEDSYKFITMRKALNENWKEARRLDKEVKKYDRYCTEFNYKYKNSKFKITDIRLVAHTLDRALKDFNVTIPEIKKFVVLFCRLTRNMDSNNVVEHSYMYYTIKNILDLDYLKIDSDAYNTIKENVYKVICFIRRNAEIEYSFIKKDNK